MNEATERAYIDRVASVLQAFGYRVEEQFVKGEQIITGRPAPEVPEYVIRIDLDGPYADLTWDTLTWSITVCQDEDADPDPQLSQQLTDQVDAPPVQVLRLARLVLDEAIRRWGNPKWTITPAGRAAIDAPPARRLHMAEQMAARLLRVEDPHAPKMTFHEIKTAASGRDGDKA